MANIRVETRKSPLLWALPLVVAGLGLTTWALWPASGPAPADSAPLQSDPSAAQTTTSPLLGDNAGPGSASGTAPQTPTDLSTDVPADRSLGTLFDLDNQGRLAISGRTKDALDTILGTYPRGPSTQEWNAIEDKLAKDLPKPALQQAMQLLHSAHQLNLSLEQLKNANPNAEAEGRSLEMYAQIKTLRRQTFDARTADLLFGEEESWGSVLLGIQAIEANPKLTPEAKKQQTQELINSLPAELKGKASQLLGQ
jgi:Proteobacterial lipase chaperone protein